MKTYNLKSVARRGSMLTAAFVIAGASLLPFTSASADALNPLTDRSLTLSSSAPGWDYLDGSGNATYAPPNSGANGKKTGNTFAFKVSTNTDTGNSADYVKAMTFQYCTTSAGNCMGPGNNGFTGDPLGGTGVAIPNSAATDTAQTSDLEVILSSPTEVQNANFSTLVDTATGNVKSIPAAGIAGRNYVVYYNEAGTWTQSEGWTMTAVENQWGDQADGRSTEKPNEIRLVNTTGQGFEAGQEVKVVFFATDSNYITNPGDDAFFVKINTYKTDTPANFNSTTLIDGGVTVANVMNQGIQITTKVLETMDFSVGTVDPYTLEAIADDTGTAGTDESESSQLYDVTGQKVHGICDPIVQGMNALTEPSNTLQLGNELGEFSLETAHTYSTHSYWRLSSNSSAGATVYYSGVTLQNTVGDDIDAIHGGDGVKTGPIKGTEQFGLAMANNADAERTVNYQTERSPTVVGPPTYGIFENGADNTAAGLANPLTADIHSSVEDPLISNATANGSYHAPQLAPLAPKTDYNNGAGRVNSEYGGAANTAFAFDTTSNTIPTPFADGTQVVDCVTGKMRYIANIAATTPAGIYTTKINYIAAPQY